MAVGLSIDDKNIANFKARLNKDFTDKCSDEKYIDPDILGEFRFDYIDFPLIDAISAFEPFGEANPKPKFITKNVKILAVQTMGKEQNHLRFALEDGNAIHNAVQFKTFEVYRSITYSSVFIY